jgi:hypothetical protein
MDVILDSNVYLSDVRMESIRFKNLFDYLRRTKSSLVFPMLVVEETVSKYRSQLEAQTKKARKEVEQLNRLLIGKDDRIRIDIQSRYAVRQMRQKFRAPAKGVSVRFHAKTAEIDVSEVFMRGVKRRRPASDDGEELRDVIIWMIVLQFAKTENKPVAFISADNGFWADAEVHEHIRSDIEGSKVDVSIFRTIDDFVKASAPAPTSVDSEAVSKFFDISTLSETILAATRKALPVGKLGFRPIAMRNTRLQAPTLSAGTLYEIDADTKLAELSYDFLVVADWEFREPSFQSGGMFSGIESHFPSPLALRGGIPLSALVRPNLEWLSSRFVPRYAESYGAPLSSPAQPERIVTKTYAISAKAQISVRLVKGALSEAELDGVEVTAVEEAVRPPLAAASNESQGEQMKGAS